MNAPPQRRILFVDDEPPVLNLLQTLFRHVNPEWDSAFTDRGAKALQLMSERPFDVLVSDMRMPEMTGADLLEQVRDRFPRTARIVLSGYSDQPMSIRALAAAHQYLSKPFTLAGIQSALNRVFGLDRFVSHPPLQEALARLHYLPTTPSTYQRLTRDLASPAASSESLAGSIAVDPALSAKLLQIVNSSFFSVPKAIVVPKEAVHHLGAPLLRTLAVSNRLIQPAATADCAGLDLEAIARHSVATGLRASRIMATERALPDAVKTAFTAGMLHDVGKLALAAALPEPYAAVVNRARTESLPLRQAEREALGVTHAEAGAYVLGLWGLPEAVVEVVAAHHNPRPHADRGFGPLTAVHVANCLESSREPESPGSQSSDLDEEYLRSLRVDRHRYQTWIASAPGSGN